MATRVVQSAGIQLWVTLIQCAWCNRISFFGRYLSLPGIGKLGRRRSICLPLLPPLEMGVSHGICQPCFDRVFGLLKREQAEECNCGCDGERIA